MNGTGPPVAHNEAQWEAPGWRRGLQLALAALWLLDAVLQFQNFMFSQGFPRMLAATAAANRGERRTKAGLRQLDSLR